MASSIVRLPEAILEQAWGKKTAVAPKIHRHPKIRLMICFRQGTVWIVAGCIDIRPTSKNPRNEMLSVNNKVGLRKRTFNVGLSPYSAIFSLLYLSKS